MTISIFELNELLLNLLHISNKRMAKAPPTKRPELLSRIEGNTEPINYVLGIVGEDAVISASDDK